MAISDHFAGPLASAWPDVGAAWLERLLLPPELALPVPPAPRRGAGAEPHVPGPTGEFVLTLDELAPHEAFLGGAP